jgi:hypothetical protein
VDGIAARPSRTILAALALALLVRAVLGLADAVAIFQGGVRAIPVPETVALSSPSPLWPFTLAVLTLAGAAGMPTRSLTGWVIALVACIAYLASGIADLGSLRPGWPLRDLGFWVYFGVNLVVPAAVLAILLAVRAWFVPSPRHSPGFMRRTAGIVRRPHGTRR